ncbi:MAG: hypothetical protein ACRYFK_14355 [Janthinobacterium lividum]
MRPLTLLLSGQPADLPATTKGLVKLSQASATLADVAARVGEYSFPLTLPPTRRNAGIFGAAKLHPQGVGKFGYFSDYPYELRVGGQVFTGTFRLTSLKNGYVGSLIGAGLSWALLLGDTKLTDLAFPTLAYDGSQLASILALGCDETDVQFPLVAFGNFYHPPLTQVKADGTTEDVPAPAAAVLDWPLSVDDYPPGVYYVNVLRQIFASIGWQLQGRELDSEFWRQVVLTCAGADLTNAWPWGSLLPATGTGQRTTASSYYQSGPAPGYTNTAAGFYTLPGDGGELSGDVFFLPVPLTTAKLRPTRTLELATATYTALRPGVYDFEWVFSLSGGVQNFGGPNIDQHDAYVQALLRPLGVGLVLRRGGQDFTEGEGGLLRGDPNAGALGYAPGQDRVLTPQRLDVPGGQLGALRLGSYQAATSGVYLETGDSVTLCVFGRRCVFDGSNKLLAYRSQSVLNFASARLSCTRYADNDGLSITALQPALFLPPLACKDVVKDFLLRVDGFLLPDAARQVATLVSRQELARAGGEPLDLSDLCDPRATEYLPAAGGVGSFVFVPVALSDDPLVPATADIVTAPVGPGDTSQQLTSLFAPVGSRPVWLPRGAYVSLPTCSTKDILAQARSETSPDSGSQAPRLVRYTGPDPGQVVPFGQGSVPLAGAVWDGALAWDGAAGAVATYYQPTLARALTGHLARVQVPLRPDYYQVLGPGRRVLLHGAPYTVEALQNYDPSDEAALAQLDLSREVF